MQHGAALIEPSMESHPTHGRCVSGGVRVLVPPLVVAQLVMTCVRQLDASPNADAGESDVYAQ